MKAIILAAGYATRLYPLTLNTPKALLPIAGKPMLDYLVEGIAETPEMTEVHIVSNHRFADQFERWKQAAETENRYPGLSFRVWDDGTTSNDDRLGAIGDIQFVLDRADMNDDVLIAASDNFFTFPLSLFVDAFKRQNRDLLLGGTIEDVETLRRFAVATLDADGKVLKLAEKPQHPESTTGIYALYLYRQDTLPLFKTYLDAGNCPDSPGRFPEWLCRRGYEMGAYLFEGECVDIGTHESYEEVCARFGGRESSAK